MLNKDYEPQSVVKSDRSVEQMMYIVRRLRRRSQASFKERLFEGTIGLKRGSMLYFIRLEDCKIVETNSILCSRVPEKESKHQGRLYVVLCSKGRLLIIDRREYDVKKMIMGL